MNCFGAGAAAISASFGAPRAQPESSTPESGIPLYIWELEQDFPEAVLRLIAHGMNAKARLDWYPEADHCPFLLEPERFALALLAFLAGDAQAPGASYMG